MLTMYLSRLILATAGATRQSQRGVERSVKAFLDLICGYLTKGQNVKLTGFGTFNVRHRKSRRVINPQTGRFLILMPRKVVRFTPSARLRKAVR